MPPARCARQQPCSARTSCFLPLVRSRASTYLALRANGLLGGFRRDAKLAQDRRNVVVAAFLHDLAAFVEPTKHAALQVNALVVGGGFSSLGFLEGPSVRPDESD